MEFRDSEPQDYEGIVNCIYQGFKHHLDNFKTSETKIKEILLKTIKLDKFKVALDNGEVIACFGLSKGGSRLYKKDGYSYTKEFGAIKGFVIGQTIYQILGKPHNITADYGYIEFVTTLAEYRGKGIMKELLKRTIEKGEYRKYMLDVASNNENAIKLYESLGFTETHRVKEKFAKQAGFEYNIFMKLEV